MDEAFLHFLWKFSKFDTTALESTSGEQISIFNPGIHNDDSGPDFSNARLKISDIEWVGNVEIHIRSSDWDHHGHSDDPAYDNVILHVVWKHDREIKLSDDSTIPTLELEPLIEESFLRTYSAFINQPAEILCSDKLDNISELIWNSNLDKMLSLRLEEKSSRLIAQARKHNFDWEEIAYQCLSRNLGFSLNGDVFERLALLTPLVVIRKHIENPRQVQALVFGQAGFLDDPRDDFQRSLLSEYEFLKAKYNLIGLKKVEWKFGTMRPANFPSVRLTQLSFLLVKTTKLFSAFVSFNSIKDIKRLFSVDYDEYWSKHYDFSKSLKRGGNQFGNSSLENIAINTVSPLLAAYSIYSQKDELKEKAVLLLEQLKPESNRYTRKFEKLGRQPSSAFDSQAQILLYNDFCKRKKCLNCAVGSAIFNR